MKFILLLPLFLLFNCSQRQTIGTETHLFGQKAKKIIWFQVAGLGVDHVSFLKMDQKTAELNLSFDQMNCFASTWAYNFYDLRPSAANGFRSQMLGSRDIKGECSDLDRPFVWDLFREQGYEVGIYEHDGVAENSLEAFLECKSDFNKMSSIYLWKQAFKKKGEDKAMAEFHFQENSGVDLPNLYYDKSCNSGTCFASLEDNIKSLWKKFNEKNSKTFFVVRDFSYQKLLERGKVKEAKEFLNELNRLLGLFISKYSEESTLVLLTGSHALGLEFPKAGKQWEQYEKTGRILRVKNSKLMSSAWAMGDGAENFCGIYPESDIYRRLLWMPETNFFNLVF